MENKILKFLFNPTIGKIAAIFIGDLIICLIIKVLQRNLFSKMKDNVNRYRAKKLSSFIGIILEKFEASNGEIKFASATFQIIEGPKIKVNLKQ